MSIKFNFNLNVNANRHNLRIDHLGIAVKSLADSKRLYEMLGLVVAFEETVKQEQVRVAMIPMGQSRVELLEATSEDSVIAKYIAKHGEGLHHVALKVERLEELVEKLKQNGVRLVKDTIQTGAGGHRYVFLHPASTGGVLIELCE